jgi:hypothetical protein
MAERRKLEMIDYGDEPLVDHKGRTRPLYKARSPRPSAHRRYRPGPFANLLLGLFPGARLIASDGLWAGLPYTIAGLLGLIVAVVLATRFPITSETLRILRIKPELALVHAGALLLGVVIYEVARMGSAIEERSNSPRAARFMAALAIPAAMVTFGAPRLVGLYPRFVEALWFASAVVLVGSIPAAFRCAFDLRRKNAVIVFALVVIAAIGGVVTIAMLPPPARAALAATAAAYGFEILPKLLS